MKVKNFLFHRVHPEQDAFLPATSPKAFKKILDYICKRYQVVPIPALLQKSPGQSSSSPLATLSFDDGFLDNFEFAAPILLELGLPASFYVTTQSVDKNIPIWTYLCDYFFRHTKKNSLQITDLVQNVEKDEALSWRLESEKLIVCRKIKRFLKLAPHATREKAMKQLTRKLEVLPPDDMMMNWEHLKKLVEMGFEIGSHTSTHTLLATVQDEGALKTEILDSGKTIRKKLGFFPAGISYPNDSYNSNVTQLVEKTGYQYGLAVGHRTYNTQGDSLYEIPRFDLYSGEAWWKTRLRIDGSYYTISKIAKQWLR